MARTSTSSSWWDAFPKMTAASIYVPRLSTVGSCLSGSWEALKASR